MIQTLSFTSYYNYVHYTMLKNPDKIESLSNIHYQMSK
jgi:hypothetical protein